MKRLRSPEEDLKHLNTSAKLTDGIAAGLGLAANLGAFEEVFDYLSTGNPVSVGGIAESVLYGFGCYAFAKAGVAIRKEADELVRTTAISGA